MPTKRDLIRKEIEALYNEGVELGTAFKKDEATHFRKDYQRWYTKALTAVESLAADRLSEFKSY